MPQLNLLERLLSSLLIGILVYIISHAILQKVNPRGANSGVKLEVLNRAAVASTDPNTPPAVPVAEVDLRYPKRMRTSETDTVKALLYPKEGGFKLTTPTEAILESPSFDITNPTAQPAVLDLRNLDHLEWNWLITPKKVGSHLLTVRIAEHGGNTISLQPIVAGLVTIDRNTATVHIDVVTSLGLSAWWADGIPLLLAIITIIIAFPVLNSRVNSVLKRFFTRRP